MDRPHRCQVSKTEAPLPWNCLFQNSVSSTITRGLRWRLHPRYGPPWLHCHISSVPTCPQSCGWGPISCISTTWTVLLEVVSPAAIPPDASSSITYRTQSSANLSTSPYSLQDDVQVTDMKAKGSQAVESQCLTCWCWPTCCHLATGQDVGVTGKCSWSLVSAEASCLQAVPGTPAHVLRDQARMQRRAEGLFI